VRSPNVVIRTIERLWEPVALRQSGDHLLRDPLDHLADAGFEVVSLERRRLGLIERLVARRLPDR